MRAGSSRRILRSRLLRIAVVVFLAWTFLEAFYIHRNFLYEENPTEWDKTQKIFITGLAWNNEILFRTHLSQQIVDLVRTLGVENVYISIYENGSYDGTKDALHELTLLLEGLGVRNTITLNETSHEEIIKGRPIEPKTGWLQVQQTGFERVNIHKGDYALRRIHYLAELRNKALEPLWHLAQRGEKFDKILFLTDVVFSVDDVLKLLQTNNGRYATACSLDFETPPSFYDTFALRDSEGLVPLMRRWPFFRSAASRKAVKSNGPVPVRSCWNGIVAMSAAPFYNNKEQLRFRGVPDSLAVSHVEGSECCLIHADNPLSAELGVWMNPKVRVGYCHPDLQKHKVELTWEAFTQACQAPYDAIHAPGSWVSHFQIAWGLFENRIRRLLSFGVHNWKVRARVWAWMAESDENIEPGEMCLVDEMHILQPKGWLHI